MKLAKLFGTAALFAAMATTAQAANTLVTVKVKNSASTLAEYTYEYFSGSVAPAPESIATGETKTFQLTSGADTVSGMRFVYAAGNKKCRFAASHTVNFSTKVPSWTKTGTSFGTTRATCNASITAAQAGSPYNYTVEFEIK